MTDTFHKKINETLEGSSTRYNNIFTQGEMVCFMPRLKMKGPEREQF